RARVHREIERVVARGPTDVEGGPDHLDDERAGVDGPVCVFAMHHVQSRRSILEGQTSLVAPQLADAYFRTRCDAHVTSVGEVQSGARSVLRDPNVSGVDPGARVRGVGARVPAA